MTLENSESLNLKKTGLRNFFTPNGLEGFENAISAFSQHSYGELQDPDIMLETRGKTEQDIENAIQGLIQKIQARFFKKGFLNTDITTILSKLDKEIVNIFPEYADATAYFSEAYGINEIYEKAISYFLSHIALNEQKLRNHKKGNTHIGFFTLLDNLSFVTRFSEDPSQIQKMIMLTNKYRYIRDFWMPFFQRDDFQDKNPRTQEAWEKGELENLNNRIAIEILDNQCREVPFCTIDNESLLNDNNLITQFAPVSADLGSFNFCIAQINFFGGEAGLAIKDNKDLQDLSIVKRTRGAIGEMDISVMLSDSESGALPAPFFIGRYAGDIYPMGMGKEAIKLLSEKTNPLAYEILRFDVLWYFAQLVCRRGTLQDIFGDVFKINKRGKYGKREKKDEEEKKEDNVLIFPRGGIGDAESRADFARSIFDLGEAEDIIEELENEDTIKEKIEDLKDGEEKKGSSKSSHKRLGRLIRKLKKDPDTGEYKIIIKPSLPSEEAKLKAAKSGQELGIGVEFVDIEGGVFYPEEIPALLNKFKVKSIDELINECTEKGMRIFRRYETWIEGEKSKQMISRFARVKSKNILNREG